MIRKSKLIYGHGKEIDVVKGVIGTSGIYSFKQKFPSTIVEKTKVNGTMAASGATKIIFDRLTNVSFSGTNHEENQPCHLQLKDTTVPIKINLEKYDNPETCVKIN